MIIVINPQHITILHPIVVKFIQHSNRRPSSASSSGVLELLTMQEKIANRANDILALVGHNVSLVVILLAVSRVVILFFLIVKGIFS